MKLTGLILMSLLSWKVFAGPGQHVLQRRGPASVDSCPAEGCACEPLKVLSVQCESARKKSSSPEINRIYGELMLGIRRLREEGFRQSLKECPYQAAAEQCRIQIRSLAFRQKTRSRHYKTDFSEEMGLIGTQMIEMISEQSETSGRQPASTRPRR